MVRDINVLGEQYYILLRVTKHVGIVMYTVHFNFSLSIVQNRKKTKCEVQKTVLLLIFIILQKKK